MTEQFKYILDKSSKKHLCPNCNKKSFVKFIDSTTKYYLSETEGRCDRETKCGYFKKPKSNATLNPAFFGNTEIFEPSYHSLDVLSKYGNTYKQNSFITYLLKYFAPIDVKHAIRKYFLGTVNLWNGATVFWQVDELMRVKGGKIMLYDCNTGKRIKKPYNHISWMHKFLIVKRFELQQCLFGLHNLCDYNKNERTICLVESEKTAIIMSILFPFNLWLATGSKSNFKEALLKPIKEYRIIAYPDKTEFETWNSTVLDLQKSGFRITCSDLLEKTDLENGCDLIDLILPEKKA